MTDQAPARRRRPTWPAVLAVPLTLLAAARPRPAVAQGPDDLADVSFGWPVAFLHQDQRSLDPPYPHEIGFLTPTDVPTRISWGALLADLTAVTAGLAVLARLRGGRRRPG